MIEWGAAAALLLMSTGGAPDEAGVSQQPLRFAQMMIREQIIVRVPSRMRKAAPPRSSQIEWVESRGPKCVSAKSIAGASLLGPDSVDLILRNNSRIRAKLESSCPALDYYYGFYISPHRDGKICADRDTIRSRMGGQCEIQRFKTLTPAARD